VCDGLPVEKAQPYEICAEGFVLFVLVSLFVQLCFVSTGLIIRATLFCLYWSHYSCNSVLFVLVSLFVQLCFLLEYLQIYSFLSGSPYTYAQHNTNKQTNKQTNIFPLVTETFHALLSNNTHSGMNKTKQNKTKLQATSGLTTV